MIAKEAVAGTEAPALRKLVRELARRLGVRPKASTLEAMAEVARAAEEELELVREFLSLDEKLPAPRRRALARGLSRAMHLAVHPPAGDPLAVVDDPLEPGEAIATVALAESGAEAERQRILVDCVSAPEAARLTRRSRQALERLRREGRALALREGNQWRYPRWQFDVDAPGGVLAGLGEAVHRLGCSPAAAAFWLTRRSERLEGLSPLELLRRRRSEPVVRLAEEQRVLA